MSVTSVGHSLLSIKANKGKGRTWAVCHALLVGGTTSEVIELAKVLYAQAAPKHGWDEEDEIERYTNFSRYVARLAELGITAWRDEQKIWHTAIRTT